MYVNVYNYVIITSLCSSCLSGWYYWYNPTWASIIQNFEKKKNKDTKNKNRYFTFLNAYDH